MSKTGETAAAITQAESVEQEIRNSFMLLTAADANLLAKYMSAVEQLKDAAANAVGSDLEDLRHHTYDCRREGCTNETCKQNPNGLCENCGTMRSVGAHYQTEPVWAYACVRNY